MAFHSVFAHIELKHIAHGVLFAQSYAVEAHIRADKILKFIGRYFAETFKSSDFGIVAEFFDGRNAFFLAVAVVSFHFGVLQSLRRVGCFAFCFLLVSNAEEWSLQNVDMPRAHQFGEELQQESEHKQSNVHAVDIGIGGDDYAIVAQVLETVFDVKSSLQKVEFLVLVNDFLLHTERVERFSTQREHSLSFHIANFGNAAACRKTLGDENR